MVHIGIGFKSRMKNSIKKKTCLGFLLEYYFSIYVVCLFFLKQVFHEVYLFEWTHVVLFVFMGLHLLLSVSEMYR